MVAEVASIEVTLKLLGVDRYQSSMRSAGSLTEQTGQRVTRTMDSIANSTDRMVRSSEGIARGDGALRALTFSALRADTSITALTRGLQAAGVALGGLAGGVAVNAFRNYADQATNIQNRLATVIPVQQQRLRVENEIFQSAQRSRTSYEATANLFSRLTLSSTQLGANQAQILRVVETTQKALIAGGATVQEAAAVATQLTQSLGSGRLNGDELKSIAENSPVLIQAIAKEFGVSVGALKELGTQGELSATRVFSAILNSTGDVERMFARTTPTIAAGIQQIDNALVRYIGNVDQSIGATKALVGGLEFVAANLDNIGDSAGLAIAAVAGSLLGRGATKATTAVRKPFVEAREAADNRLAAAREARQQASYRQQAAFNEYFRSLANKDAVAATPSLALAGAKPIAELEAAEKRLAGAREMLKTETGKLAGAEAARNTAASERIEVQKRLIAAEEAAARAVSNSQQRVAAQAMDYQVAAGGVLSADPGLGKRDSERLAKATAERAAAQARVAAIDAAADAARQQIATLSQPAAGPRVRQNAARAAALNADLERMKADRNKLGLELYAIEREAATREEQLAQTNVAARKKHGSELERIGEDLVAAERKVAEQRRVVSEQASRNTGYAAKDDAAGIREGMRLAERSAAAQKRLTEIEGQAVDQRKLVAQRAAEITGYDADGKAMSAAAVLGQIDTEIKAREKLTDLEGKIGEQRKVVASAAADIANFESKGRALSPDAVLRQVEAEISGREKLAELEAKSAALATRYNEMLERSPQVSGSLKPDQVRDLNAVRTQRTAMIRELAQMDAEIASKQQERDQAEARLSTTGRRKLAADAQNSAKVDALNTGLAATVAERETLAAKIEQANGTIEALETQQAQRLATARQSAFERASAAADSLRKVQESLVQDLETLNQRRAAIADAEVTSETKRAERLAGIDRQIDQRKQQITQVQSAVKGYESGAEQAREAISLSAQGKIEEAERASQSAAAAVGLARRSADEAVQNVARAQRAAGVVAILQSTAARSLGALSGLVNFLGGPAGAAFAAAGVGLAGYALYQARAEAEVKKHAEAVKLLVERTEALNAAQGAGKMRTDRQLVEDTNTARNAIRSTRDASNGALSTLSGAVRAARPSSTRGTVEDEYGGFRSTTTLDDAARRAGTSIAELMDKLRTLDPNSREAGDAMRQLADIMLDAARVDPRLAERAIEMDELAKKTEAAQKATRDYFEASQAAQNVKLPTPLDYDGSFTVAPKFNAEAGTAAVKGYLDEIGDGIDQINGTPIRLEGIDTSVAEIRSLVETMAAGRAQVSGLVSGQTVPSFITDAIQSFKEGSTSSAEFGAKLQELKEKYPDFAPLIQSLIEANERILNAQASAQALGLNLDGLDGRVVNILFKMATSGKPPDLAAAAAKEQAAADKVIDDADFKARVDVLKAGGHATEAAIEEQRRKTPRLDANEFRERFEANQRNELFVQQEESKNAAQAAAIETAADTAQKTAETRMKARGQKREAAIRQYQRENPLMDSEMAARLAGDQYDAEQELADSNKKGRKGRKSQSERDADTLAKKLRELDQDARVAALDAFDQKTVRFAQDAKVASDQIDAFIKAAQSGDLSGVPPVMQEIYEKMKLLEGVKLAKNALDEIFPARKLARELEELRAAANASPEIAANIDLIEMHIRSKNAPEWASGISDGIKDAARSVVTQSATIGDAMQNLQRRLLSIAFDVAFKPLEDGLKGLLGGMGGGGGGGGFASILSSLFGGGGGAADGFAGMPMEGGLWLAEGGIVTGPGSGTSDEIPAMISNGEAVIPARAVANNRSLVEALISDRLPRYATGLMPASVMMAGSMQAQESAMNAVPQMSAVPASPGINAPITIHMQGSSGDPAADRRAAEMAAAAVEERMRAVFHQEQRNSLRTNGTLWQAGLRRPG